MVLFTFYSQEFNLLNLFNARENDITFHFHFPVLNMYSKDYGT